MSNLANNKIKLEADIKEIYNSICQAFSILDIDKVLSYFSNSKNMVKISNGGVLRGKKQLTEYWQQSIGSRKDLQISIKNVEIHVMDDKHIWATADENISFCDQNYNAIVSNIFVRSTHGWKILLDHTTYIRPE